MQLALPVDAGARLRARPRDSSRPWYRYAVSLLPAQAGRWVDLGCGRGEFLALARQTGRSGLALDRRREDAAEAGADARAALVADLARPLPFRDAALDGASLIEVIEHVWPAEALAAELARVVRPGGWLLVSTPNVVHWTYRWRALTGHGPKQEGYHVRFFTQRTLAELFARAGFRARRRASFGKQALLCKLAALAGRREKVRYRVPAPLEALLAQHFVWLLERVEGAA
jgi:SAM-dependent methyltransferase